MKAKLTLLFISTFTCSLLFGLFQASAKVVEKGDQITFRLTELTNKKNIREVKWSQFMSERTENYIELTAAIKGEKLSLTTVFISSKITDQVKKNCTGGTCTLKVDSAFQYGQNNEKTVRFLVLHNKSNKPYQHRFVETSMLSMAATGAENTAKSAGLIGGFVPQAAIAAKTGEIAIKKLKALVGDPLRDF
jgi:hypothetical protein